MIAAPRRDAMRPIYCALLTDLFNRIGPTRLFERPAAKVGYQRDSRYAGDLARPQEMTQLK